MKLTQDAYSPLKGSRHLDVIQGVRDVKPTRPVHVQIILSDLCNQSCDFCAYRDPSYSSSQLFYSVEPGTKKGLRKLEQHPERNYNPNRMIPYEKAIEIIDDCAEMGVEAIQLTGGGEPTVHPEFLEIFRYIRQKQMSVALVTNGIQPYKRNWHFDLTLASWVRVSLDAGTPETYARIRHVHSDQFYQALGTVYRICVERERQGLRDRPILGVGFVVTPDNWKEVGEAARLAKESGADNIRISAQFSAQDEHLFAGFYKDCAALCAQAEELSNERFTVYNRFGQKLDDLRHRSPDYDLCGYQFMTTYIGGDLNVYRCCVLAYNESGIVGSLKDQRFKDLWMNQQRAEEMIGFNAGSCERCQFNTINHNLEYMMRSREPQHAEFV